MHQYSDLAYRCSLLTINSLKEIEEKLFTDLQTSGSPTLIKNMQISSLQRTILAVGMFSVFEALLQDRLNCKDGFSTTKEILNELNETELLEQFIDLHLAINSLKHGRGRSYNTLLAKQGGSIPSRVRGQQDLFFDEGDISEISTLIEVDDNFIYHVVEVIRKVTDSIEKNKPGLSL